MFPTLKRLYDLKLFDKTKIAESVECNWITKEQYTEITGEPYPGSVDTPTNINIHAHSYQATIEAE